MLAKQFAKQTYNFPMVLATAETLLSLLEGGDAEINASVENTLSYSDILADTFTVVKRDLESGAMLYVEEGGEVDLLLETLRQLFDEVFNLQSAALAAEGGHVEHPGTQLKRNWGTLIEAAKVAADQREQAVKASKDTMSNAPGAGGQSGGGGGGGGGYEHRPEDGDEFKLQTGRMVRFEPCFVAEHKDFDLFVELDRNNQDHRLLFEGMSKYFHDQYKQFIKFRTKKTDSSTEIRDEHKLRDFMSLLAGGSVPAVIYMIGTGTDMADKLPPKQVILSSLLGGRGQGGKEFYDQTYEKFKLKFQGQTSLNKTEFVEFMREGLGLTGEKETDLEQLFETFDTDNDKSVDFTEILVGITTMMTGSEDEKLDHLFSAFDLDNNDAMDLKELAKMLEFLNPDYPPQFAVNMAMKLMDKFDTQTGTGETATGAAATSVGKDGVLNRGEFKAMIKAESWVLPEIWKKKISVAGFQGFKKGNHIGKNDGGNNNQKKGKKNKWEGGGGGGGDGSGNNGGKKSKGGGKGGKGDKGGKGGNGKGGYNGKKKSYNQKGNKGNFGGGKGGW